MDNLNESLPAIIVPAYKPEERLLTLVDELLKMNFSFLILVDDGSGPKFQPIFDQARLKSEKIIILTHAVNLGKGAALKTAFNYLLVSHPQERGAVTADADGQHLPQDIKNVALELIRNPDALVLGARTFRQDVPLRSRFGNILTGHIFRLLVGRRIKDTQTGLRGIPARLMKAMLSTNSNRYEFELDMLISAASQKIVIKEVMISTIYEENNKSSHFNPLLDSFRIYFLFLRFISVSLLTYCTDLTVFTVSYRTAHHMFPSVLLGRLCGLVVAIIGAKRYVFKSDMKFSIVATKITILWAVLLGLSYALMLLFVDKWNFNVYGSRVFIDMALFTFNFLIQRDLIFGSQKEA
jgi:glycosyltransferase involved in cell wall biosynthesis